MAYSPIEQGRLLGNPVLRDIAARHDASPVQIALACPPLHAQPLEMLWRPGA